MIPSLPHGAAFELLNRLVHCLAKDGVEAAGWALRHPREVSSSPRRPELPAEMVMSARTRGVCCFDGRGTCVARPLLYFYVLSRHHIIGARDHGRLSCPIRETASYSKGEIGQQNLAYGPVTVCPGGGLGNREKIKLSWEVARLPRAAFQGW